MSRTDPAEGPDATTVHATCVVVGEGGILIRGAAGAGKSSLALGLLDRAEREGLHAQLVGDDRIRIERHHGRLVARPHPAIVGLIEVRGLGLRTVPALDAAILRLVVDCVERAERLPEPAEAAVVLGIALPRLVLDRAVRETGQAPAHVMGALAVASRSQCGALGPGPAEAP
ncbi:HPr kinase/phosphorylase [Methylobacterium segetis]|uniref:HPr kinase/phosphorylase n=1 Tax=Methylobacterium segetis TaxID=2488750 RepID=UPI00104CEE42|nr:HPr kinase/phosphatase C-terminal domain-containing protein [Methylobacterium segetis]